MATQQPSTHKDVDVSGESQTVNLGDIFKADFSLPDFIANVKSCLFQDAEALQQASTSIFPDAKSDAGNSATSDIAWLAESELDRVCVHQ
jgi:hypothetical protein